MKTITILTILYTCVLCSCDNTGNFQTDDNSAANDSLKLTQMVRDRENAMKKKDIVAVMTQFSDDATFINAAGFYCGNKKEIENFHNKLTQMDSIGYYYIAGTVTVRLLDSKNALVYYPWRMDWFNITDPTDTLKKEIGLMTLSAQKRNEKWLWVAITNQHTYEYFDDLTKHKRQ